MWTNFYNLTWNYSNFEFRRIFIDFVKLTLTNQSVRLILFFWHLNSRCMQNVVFRCWRFMLLERIFFFLFATRCIYVTNALHAKCRCMLRCSSRWRFLMTSLSKIQYLWIWFLLTITLRQVMLCHCPQIRPKPNNTLICAL